MPYFTYVARNTQGKLITGRTEAATQAMVVKQLRDAGLTPTQIESAGGSAAAGKSKVRKQRYKGGAVKLEDLVLASRQLATMIRAGLPLIEVLNIMGEQVEKMAMRNCILAVERDVQNGSSLYEAMAKHPRIFNQFFLSMIKAGEASGMLDTILDQVATYMEKTASIVRKVKAAIMYPAVVSVAAVLIVILIMWKVVPVFEEIFDGLGSDLPALTKLVIAVSRFVRDQWYILGGVAIAAYFIFKYWVRTKSGRRTWDRLKLKIPVFGELLLKLAIARFTRTLGTLMRAGVNILGALDIVAKTAGNVTIEEVVLKTKFTIQAGESLTKPLAESGVFPPLVTRMIEVGERTGALESMLGKVAEYYEDQVDTMVDGLTSLIEPLLIMVLGVIVGTIVISMFMPLVKMLETIQSPPRK